MLRRLKRAGHAIDRAIGRASGSRRVLVDLRTPVCQAVLGPVYERLEGRRGLSICFTSEYPGRIAPLLGGRRCLTHREVEWRRFDLYLNADPWAAARLRRELLRAAAACDCHALLGPVITTPHLWVAQCSVLQSPVISGYARELLLTEALVRYPYLYGKARPWHLTESLLHLFDELTLHQCDLPQDVETFHARLAQAYGVRAEAPQALSREATLVHTLWYAWHEQLRSTHSVDAQSAYLLQLAHSTGQLQPGTYVYAAGFSRWCAAEIAWIQTLAARTTCTVILHGSGSAPADDGDTYEPLKVLAEAFGTPMEPDAATSARADFLDAAFGPATLPLAARARAYAAQQPISRVAAHWALFAARGAEADRRGRGFRGAW